MKYKIEFDSRDMEDMNDFGHCKSGPKYALIIRDMMNYFDDFQRERSSELAAHFKSKMRELMVEHEASPYGIKTRLEP